jgi:hypothetical protein
LRDRYGFKHPNADISLEDQQFIESLVSSVHEAVAKRAGGDFDREWLLNYGLSSLLSTLPFDSITKYLGLAEAKCDAEIRITVDGAEVAKFQHNELVQNLWTAIQDSIEVTIDEPDMRQAVLQDSAATQSSS